MNEDWKNTFKTGKQCLDPDSAEKKKKKKKKTPNTQHLPSPQSFQWFESWSDHQSNWGRSSDTY